MKWTITNTWTEKHFALSSVCAISVKKKGWRNLFQFKKEKAKPKTALLPFFQIFVHVVTSPPLFCFVGPKWAAANVAADSNLQVAALSSLITASHSTGTLLQTAGTPLQFITIISSSCLMLHHPASVPTVLIHLLHARSIIFITLQWGHVFSRWRITTGLWDTVILINTCRDSSNIRYCARPPPPKKKKTLKIKKE